MGVTPKAARIGDREWENQRFGVSHVLGNLQIQKVSEMAIECEITHILNMYIYIKQQYSWWSQNVIPKFLHLSMKKENIRGFWSPDLVFNVRHPQLDILGTADKSEVLAVAVGTYLLCAPEAKTLSWQLVISGVFKDREMWVQAPL